MAKIVNLGREKKRRTRGARRAAADANAAKHGVPGPEKRRLKAEAEKAGRAHEGHRLDDGD